MGLPALLRLNYIRYCELNGKKKRAGRWKHKMKHLERCITLKWKDDDGKEMVKTYHVHSQVYASHSKFIDTALSIEY
jgi:hypothetical protein